MSENYLPNIDTVSDSIIVKKLKAVWTIEAEQDLQTWGATDAFMKKLMADPLVADIKQKNEKILGNEQNLRKSSKKKMHWNSLFEEWKPTDSI